SFRPQPSALLRPQRRTPDRSPASFEFSFDRPPSSLLGALPRTPALLLQAAGSPGSPTRQPRRFGLTILDLHCYSGNGAARPGSHTATIGRSCARPQSSHSVAVRIAKIAANRSLRGPSEERDSDCA